MMDEVQASNDGPYCMGKQLNSRLAELVVNTAVFCKVFQKEWTWGSVLLGSLMDLRAGQSR